MDREQLMTKSSLRLGDILILTKALGTGTLLAADMRAKAAGRWIEDAIDSMLQPNGPAASCLRNHGASACTDITGFGLAGHLVEMLGEGPLGATIDIEALPVLDGALATLADGIVSTLQEKNERFSRHFGIDATTSVEPRGRLLFDPQTSGGLLAGIPADRVDICRAELHTLGYTQAAVIGRVVDATRTTCRIRLDKPTRSD
jgi:selenide,water dikinase